MRNNVVLIFNSQNVTADMFLRVLEGDRKLKESGLKVLESGPEDNLFIFFTDHEAPNLIVFPSGQVSLFSLFTVAGANPTESGWVTFCLDKTIDTCLGDEFSYNWMTDTDKVPEVAKYLEKLDHLCEQGYDASVITQAIFTACE
ncbi:hypothetical protein D915_009081 [Fasciola hepatica]|uniref:Uncharacterized protein n=1 Tax=Fasciola hepatica TaxID=6192 RepID=A0A4E0RWZ5_FASHE|nr:hypothetical protein D915_009081 [Fasciola hepatica]